MPKIFSRVGSVLGGIASDISKQAKGSNIGVHKGGRIGSKDMGIDLGKGMNTFLPMRSKFQNYSKLNPPIKRNKSKHRGTTEVRTEYEKDGKKITTIRRF